VFHEFLKRLGVKRLILSGAGIRKAGFTSFFLNKTYFSFCPYIFQLYVKFYQKQQLLSRIIFGLVVL